MVKVLTWHLRLQCTFHQVQHQPHSFSLFEVATSSMPFSTAFMHKFLHSIFLSLILFPSCLILLKKVSSESYFSSFLVPRDSCLVFQGAVVLIMLAIFFLALTNLLKEPFIY